ncbi:hypothetical protein BTVI_69499 [Pitangus sulphuratus]|nr:hypothetical protein BTVI_69499 [Pitangus sulphuratus]
MKVVQKIPTGQSHTLGFRKEEDILPGGSDMSHRKMDTVKGKVFQKTCQSLPCDIPEHNNSCPLSSSHHMSHEPLLKLMIKCTMGFHMPCIDGQQVGTGVQA